MQLCYQLVLPTTFNNESAFFAQKGVAMKKQRKKNRFTIEDRMLIQACIHDNRNLVQIVTRPNVSKSTFHERSRSFLMSDQTINSLVPKETDSIYSMDTNALGLVRKRRCSTASKPLMRGAGTYVRRLGRRASSRQKT